MLSKTRGIAIHQIKYSETSIVAYVYTEQYGRQAYLVKGARGKNAVIRSSLFQPLYLLDMEVYHKSNTELQKIKEVVNTPVYGSIPFQSVKTAISIFLAEVLYRTVREETQNPSLFSFIYHSAQIFDVMEKGIADFHLVFLMQLTKYLGFYPSNNFGTDSQLFDLLSGRFVASVPFHGQIIEPRIGMKFAQLTTISFDQMNILHFNSSERREILAYLIDFYKCHVEGMGHIRSLAVLSEVFR